MDRMLVRIPDRYVLERSYVINVIFREFWGLSYNIVVEPRANTCIQYPGDSKTLGLRDALFRTPESHWLTPKCLPEHPLLWYDIGSILPEAKLCETKIPIIYSSKDSDIVSFLEDNINLSLDIFGACFFFLTRYEEVVLNEKDEYGRFPYSSSLAYREGFLERPIVNEYVEILWSLMKRLWPRLERKQRHYAVIPTHDVDWPFVGYKVPLTLVLRGTIGDVIKRRDPSLAWKRLGSRILHNRKTDPANVFDFILSESERLGLRSEFYFIADHTAGMIDGVYSLMDPEIQSLMLQCVRREQVIGLHPSYNSYNRPVQIKHEKNLLLQTMEVLGIQQDTLGARQHYLRWQNPTTWQAYEDASLDYDTTLGYADVAGFRCGTCYDYPVFNLETRCMLRLRERPLIVMDMALEQDERKPIEARIERVKTLSRACREFGGSLILLWHNSRLITDSQQAFYKEILSASV